MQIIEHIHFFQSLTINLVSIFIFAYFLYYKNHKDYQWFVTYFLFNLFIFTIIYFLWNESINMTVGFAIFGLVWIVRLRSDTMSKTDIVYFLGSLTLAIINSIWSIRLFQIIVNILILWITFLLEKTNNKNTFKKLEITLDQIPKQIFTNKKKTTDLLSEQLDIEVLDYQVNNINQIKDSIDMTIIWK